MSDLQYFLLDESIEVCIDPIDDTKFETYYGAEFNADELIFMLEKLGVDVRKLQAENAELKKQNAELTKDMFNI